MAKKRGPKTEVPGEAMTRRTFSGDRHTWVRLEVLAGHEKMSQSRLVRRLINEAYRRLAGVA